MRKTSVIIAVFAVAFFSCEKKVDEEKKPSEFRLRAGVSETKTSLGDKTSDGKYPTFWNESDAISINGLVSKPLEASEAGGPSAVFTFTSAPTSAAVFNVIYPGTTQTDRLSISEGAAPLIGSTTDLESGVTLRTPAAYVRFPFTGAVTISSLEICSVSGEKISGEFVLGKASDGSFDGTMTPTSAAAASLRLGFEGGLDLRKGDAEVVFCIPAGEYAKGLRAVARASDGESMTIAFFPSGAEIETATVCSFPSLAFEAGKEIILSSTDAFYPEDEDLEESAGIGSMDAEDAAYSVSIKVGTYNIWAPSARKSVMDADETVSGQRSWANSYQAVAEMINELDCDVIGIQEVTKMVYQTTLTSGNEDYDGNVHTLNSLLPKYSWVIYNAANTTYDNLSRNTTANGLGSTDAILYKSTVLTLVSKGRAWLTGTRTVAPQEDANWDKNGTNRPATWAKFTHKASGKQFYFITTHLDLPDAGDASDPAFPQRRNIQELLEWFAPTYAPSALPSVITGDMNVDAGDSAGNYELLVSGRWQDVYDLMSSDGSLSYTDQKVKGTMNASKNEEDGLSTWRPDHILIYGFTPSYYKVGREKFPTADGSMHWPSDHLPVKAILNF